MTTDFFRAVKATERESVVFSWIEFPSKEIRDAAGKKMREDPRMKEWGEAMKFVDGKRMVFGGFVHLWTRALERSRRTALMRSDLCALMSKHYRLSNRAVRDQYCAKPKHH